MTFRGELRREQQAAADAMLSHDTGVLAATTAFGKTVVAAWLIAQRGVNTLVLVHRRQLLDQWVERLSTFLGLPAKSIGRVGGGRNRTNGLVDVALIQSLVKKGVVDDRVADYGHVIVDECHHLSAHSFESVARQAKARFVRRVVGNRRAQGRSSSDHRHAVRTGAIPRQRAGAGCRPTIRALRPGATDARSSPAGAGSRTSVWSSRRSIRISSPTTTRNRRICDDVIEAVKSGRSPLVLTERNDHLDSLEQLARDHVSPPGRPSSGMGKKQRQAVADRLAAIPADEGRVVLATGKYVGEGFDDARLDTLFLTLPVSWRGTVAQYAGRLHRLHDAKREVRIYDYADVNVPMLGAHVRPALPRL